MYGKKFVIAIINSRKKVYFYPYFIKINIDLMMYNVIISERYGHKITVPFIITLRKAIEYDV